jgi:predicted extracellular nuclease
VRGIVTAKRFNNGFFIQTPDAIATLEGDPATSEGLFVFTSSAPSMVNVGDDVLVTGLVSEFSPSADPRQPPVTEIVAPSSRYAEAASRFHFRFLLTAASLNPPVVRFSSSRTKGCA